MTIPKEVLKDFKEGKYSILSGYRGSIAHGMYIPESDPNSIDDKDVMMVCIPPIDHYLGIKSDLFPSNGTKELMKDSWDLVAYEIRKFMSLLSKGNPNVLSLLWLDNQYYINMSPEGKELIENRDLFVGKHVYHSFVGYAHGQLHRMTHGGTYNGHASAKRQELVKKFGFDCKNGAHLIRLLRMGTEFLTDGFLRVHREDASQLLEIKKGEWSLEQVKKESDKWFDLASQAYVNSKLPSMPDLDKINSLCIQLIKSSGGIR